MNSSNFDFILSNNTLVLLNPFINSVIDFNFSFLILIKNLVKKEKI